MSLPALHLHQLRLRAPGRLDPPCRKRDPDTGACRSPHNEQTPDPPKEKVRTDVKHTAGLEESEQSDQGGARFPHPRTCSRLDTGRATDFSFCFGPATSRSGSAYLVAAWATIHKQPSPAGGCRKPSMAVSQLGADYPENGGPR
jgi:hypothetical protein